MEMRDICCLPHYCWKAHVRGTVRARTSFVVLVAARRDVRRDMHDTEIARERCCWLLMMIICFDLVLALRSREVFGCVKRNPS